MQWGEMLASPYVPWTTDANDRPIVVCPWCQEVIVLRAMKDWESFSKIEFAEHVSFSHPDKVVRL